MDKTDYQILDMLKGNARMTFQEIGDEIDMSRVAAKKRVLKLERDGIIRGYNTCIYMKNEVIMFIDVTTQPGKYETVLEYICDQPGYIRQVFGTDNEEHIHVVAASSSVDNLKYLYKMIQKKCAKDIKEIVYHVVTEVVKDVYGGIKIDNRFRYGDEDDYEYE